MTVKNKKQKIELLGGVPDKIFWWQRPVFGKKKNESAVPQNNKNGKISPVVNDQANKIKSPEINERIKAIMSTPVEKKSVKEKPANFWFLSFGLREEKENFVENLVMLLTAGMDILSALDAVTTEVKSKNMKILTGYVKEEIDSGSTLWQAMAKTKFFSDQAVSLIKVGEESGRLVENLQVVVAQQKKDRNFKSKVRSAMMYPAFVMFVTVAVGLGISWFILPRLANVFSSLDIDLPLITKLLIGFGLFISVWGYIVIPVTIILLIVMTYFVFIFRPTRFLGQFLSMHIPGIKKLVQQTELARFGYVFGSLLEAGLPIMEALESLRNSTESLAYKKLYAFLEVSIDEGNSFRRSFERYKMINKLIPKSIQQLIVAGEQSGSLSNSLKKIGEAFEDKIDITTKNLSVIMEPILLFIVWLGVLAVAIAVILPIYSLVGSFNN